MKKLYLNMNKELVCVNPIVEYSAVVEEEEVGGEARGALVPPRIFQN